jgi:hypothetical protein
VAERRTSFLTDNFALYVPILRRFLGLAASFDFSAPEEVGTFNAVIREWRNSSLMKLILTLEEDRARRPITNDSYATNRNDTARSIQQSLIAATGAALYQPVFDEFNMTNIQRILQRLLAKEAKSKSSSDSSSWVGPMNFFSSDTNNKPDQRGLSELIDAVCDMWQVSCYYLFT